jgi:hypothetical protein
MKGEDKKTTMDRNTASMAIELNGNDENTKIKTAIESGGTKITDPNESNTDLSFDIDGVMSPAPARTDKQDN